jgi:hypothetical protein
MQNANSSGRSTRPVHPSYAKMERSVGGDLIKINTGPVAKYYCFDGVKEKVLWPQKFRWNEIEALGGAYGKGAYVKQSGLNLVYFDKDTEIDHQRGFW